jgi:hypothetical protein
VADPTTPSGEKTGKALSLPRWLTGRVSPMPPVNGTDATGRQIHKEIQRLLARHGGRIDATWYHWGTIVALGLTSATTALAALRQPVAAAICSAIATFVIAIERTFNFGGRWRWHLLMQSAYSPLAYRLNAAALNQDEGEREKAYKAILRKLETLGASEAFLPGAGGPLGKSKNRPATSDGKDDKDPQTG